MKSQKLYIWVEQNRWHTFADAELNSELAKTNFSGQAPGAAIVSLIYMEIYPAYVQPPRKQHWLCPPSVTNTKQKYKLVLFTKTVLETH